MAGYKTDRSVPFPRTGLSVGIAIYSFLLDRGLPAYPVVAMPSANGVQLQLPYVVYSLAGVTTRADKTLPGPRSVTVVLTCYGSGYDEALEVAEVANDMLSQRFEDAEFEGMVIRGIQLENASDGYDGDAYYFALTYRILTN